MKYTESFTINRGSKNHFIAQKYALHQQQLQLRDEHIRDQSCKTYFKVMWSIAHESW